MFRSLSHISPPPHRQSRISAGVTLVAISLSAGSVAAEEKHQEAKHPNILYIVADDLGYSDIGAFGGEIHTPNLDTLVKSGRILTNYHTSTVCAVTRAMLYSGTDHHLVGEGTMGAPNDERAGLPGYEGYLNNSSLSIAQLLKDGGYHTYIAGKWHLGSVTASAQTTTPAKNKTPDQWGFERSYVLLGGATSNHFGHEAANSKNYASDGQYVQPGQPGQPGGPGWTDAKGKPWYDTNFYTQQLISYIDSNINDGKPFAAFATYTSPHWPLQVPEPWLSKYKGRYDGGYEEVRKYRLHRQKLLGLIPEAHTPNPGLPNAATASPATTNNGTASASYINANTVPTGNTANVDYGPGKADPDWDSLTADQKKLQARYREIYAGQVENLDHNIGLLIQHLKEIDQYENTFIVFHSDNGAEGWPLSSAQEAINLANFDKLGGDYPASQQDVQYGLRWAEVSATPFKLFKGYTAEGGTSVPAIVHLPGQTTQLPTLRDFVHVRDAAPTLLEVAGITPTFGPASPAVLTSAQGNAVIPRVNYNGNDVFPITGLSFLGELQGNSTGALHPEPVGEEQYGRAYLYSGPWKALWVEPPWGPTDGHWQLYNIQTDRGETHDVSASHPDIVNDLYQKWTDYLHKVGGVEPVRPRGYY